MRYGSIPGIDQRVSRLVLGSMVLSTEPERFENACRLLDRFVAGCDGFRGVSRDALPAGAVAFYEKEYPYAWLGILAAVPPSHEELIYVRHQRGFALHSMSERRPERANHCPKASSLVPPA